MIGDSRRTFVLLLVASWAFTSPGCGRSATASRKSGPKVVVAHQTEKDAEHNPEARVITYVIANQGDTDLKLGPISTSCGCSSATISREVVAPGDTAVVTVEGQPPASGSRSVQIHVTTNDPGNATLTLSWNLIGHPHPPQLLTPTPVVDLGILRPGQIPPAQAVVFEILEARGTLPFVSEVSVDPDFCRIEGGMIEETNAVDSKFVNRSYRYRVSFPRALAVGTFVRQIEILSRSGGTNAWLQIPIRGLVLPVVRAIPPSVRFAEDLVGSRTSVKLMIVCEDQSSALAAECVAHDPRTKIRVLKRDADRVWFEVDCEGLDDDRAFQPFRFQISNRSQPRSKCLSFSSGVKSKGEHP